MAPVAKGGILGMANGATIRHLRPMRGGIAQVVEPNTWRVIGDRLRGKESFIPHDRSRRSRDILSQTARALGYDLAPRGAFRRYLAAGFAGPSGRAGVTRDELAGAAGRGIDSVATPLGGGGSSTGLAALASQVAGMRADLRALAPLLERNTAAAGAMRPITVEDRSGNPTDTARRVQLAGRFSP
ncbi:hypothetical protein PSU4_30070 [Pseudonocardia sulfidoxydans NBRC 16205]|uniref:Uncharacterized protein n=1 Tax=Pseudonocardia sulfidoxydans NBRC 16205 TaxID=1223511 RepID=A0A511DIB1_9PSEU|nr:hypothetical protein [Pseudonocardia sulfidoxydans]GEL24053.1 hypothetical protein PSU4_30070 [Pseudonocardia sulfidoxydans NBRC 16205]